MLQPKIPLASRPAAVRFLAGLLLVLCLTGCGRSDQFATTRVRGTVTYDGRPVTEGQLQFAPRASKTDTPGKPGAATIQPDGSFEVSTYANGDGAVIGEHTVTYLAPPPRPQAASASRSSGEPSHQGRAVPSAFAGLVVEQAQIVVVQGSSPLAIRLRKP